MIDRVFGCGLGTPGVWAGPTRGEWDREGPASFIPAVVALALPYPFRALGQARVHPHIVGFLAEKLVDLLLQALGRGDVIFIVNLDEHEFAGSAADAKENRDAPAMRL